MSHLRTAIRASLLFVAWLALPAASHAQAITAARIDQYLSGIHVDNGLKPLVGQGNTFVQRGESYNIDSRLIVAISGAETTFGAHVCSDKNAWNWFWNANTGCHHSPFDTWDAGINTVSHFLHKSYLLKGYTTIPLIGGKYCTSGCEHWVPNVTASYSALGGDPNGPFTLQANNAPTNSGQHTSPPTNPGSSPEAEPAITVTLAPATGGGKPSSTDGGPALAVQATFSNLTKQHVNNVELFRDTPQKPEHIAWLTRVPGSADSSPAFQATFAQPTSASKEPLRIKGQLVYRGKVLSVMISDPLDLPAPPRRTAWLAIGAAIGGLVLVLGVVVLIVILHKRKAASSRDHVAPVIEMTKPVAVAEHERPPVSAETNGAAQPEVKTATTVN